MNVQPSEIMMSSKKYRNIFEIMTAVIYFLMMSKSYLYQYSSELDKYLSKYEQYKIVKKHLLDFFVSYSLMNPENETEKELDNISEIIKKME